MAEIPEAQQQLEILKEVYEELQDWQERLNQAEEKVAEAERKLDVRKTQSKIFEKNLEAFEERLDSFESLITELEHKSPGLTDNHAETIVEKMMDVYKYIEDHDNVMEKKVTDPQNLSDLLHGLSYLYARLEMARKEILSKGL